MQHVCLFKPPAVLKKRHLSVLAVPALVAAWQRGGTAVGLLPAAVQPQVKGSWKLFLLWDPVTPNPLARGGRAASFARLNVQER